jgi:hypothetical protein
MEIKTVRKSCRNNTIPASEVIGHVFEVKDISQIKSFRINWDKYPEAVTDMEAGANGEHRNNHMDVPLDEIDERIITLDTSNILNE